MTSLSVIILNYATPQLTIDCAGSVLRALETEAPAGGARVVIVDNASPDDSAERIAAWIDETRTATPLELIRAAANDGFSAGNNIGLAAHAADFYLLLNSDAVVRPGAIAALLAAMRANPRAGIAGPRLVGEDGAEQVSRFRYPTPLGEFVDATGADIFFKVFRSHVVPIELGEDAEFDWIGFPAIMLRGEMVRVIGPLDDGYFMYFEDADYCRRAREDGWDIVQAPDAEVVHFQGASSKLEDDARSRRRLPKYFYASRNRFLRKWYGPGAVVRANALWYLGHAVSHARLLAGKPPKKEIAGRAGDIWTRGDWRRG